MKTVKLLCILALFITACKSRDNRKAITITPDKDSSYLISNGKVTKVHDDSVRVIIGREILPNGTLHPDTVRRVVNRAYNIGDTAFMLYENKRFVVERVEF